MHYATILSIGVTALSLSTTTLGLSIPETASLQIRAEDNNNVTPFPFDEADSAVLEKAFDAITSIPDSVLDDGEEALKEWIKSHPSSPQLTVRDDALEPRQTLFQILKCAGAIVQAIAENAFPISKLRRLKELIRVLGGARQVAKLLLKAKTFKQVLIIGGPELQQIAEILLGVTNVVNSCFSF